MEKQTPKRQGENFPHMKGVNGIGKVVGGEFRLNLVSHYSQSFCT